MKSELKAPILANESVGEVCIYVSNELLRTIDIRLPKNIEKKGIWDYFQNFLKIDIKNYEIKI